MAASPNPSLTDGNANTLLAAAIAFYQVALNVFVGLCCLEFIRAVQRRDLALVRALLAAGADPDQTDNVAGMSARDYARVDTRSPAVATKCSDVPGAGP